MATAPIYCTHKELKRVFPQMDEFDAKSPVYGWSLGLSDFYDTSFDVFYSTSVGLITDLFVDGAKIDKIAYNTTETTKLAESFSAQDVSSINVDSAVSLDVNDIIKIDNEYMRLTAVNSETGNHFTVGTPATNRGLFGTTVQPHANDASVYKIVDVTADLGDATSGGRAYSFVYDSDLDLCLL